VEALVTEAFERFLLPAAPEGLALTGVGGFGRRELFPHSDIDLLLLVERQAIAERERPAISAFIQDLWDRGLRVSQSVRTLSECCQRHDDNLELTISLLDHRYLAGDRQLHVHFSMELARFIHSERQGLARDLAQMARERHLKAGGSIYQLEPNIKESPGGLRDCHLVCWLDQLRTCEPDRIPRPEAPPELEAARAFLSNIRLELHARAGRDANLLTFDLQDEAAEQAGLEPAAWMRQYYAHARHIHRAAAREIDIAEEHASTLLVQFREWRSRVSNSDFSVSRERVYFRAPHRLSLEPELALRLFQFVARHGVRLAPETERRIAGHLTDLQHYFSQRRPGTWAELKRILGGRHCSLALRLMHQTGVLAAVLPGWQAVDCLVIRDFYHR
jgi:[protein-PII] uridylyltransferase